MNHKTVNDKESLLMLNEMRYCVSCTFFPMIPLHVVPLDHVATVGPNKNLDNIFLHALSAKRIIKLHVSSYRALFTIVGPMHLLIHPFLAVDNHSSDELSP